MIEVKSLGGLLIKKESSVLTMYYSVSDFRFEQIINGNRRCHVSYVRTIFTTFVQYWYDCFDTLTSVEQNSFTSQF